jgi:hypothetical protein
VVIGRIFQANAAPVGASWMWTLAFGHHEDRTPTHGYEATREAAMAALRRAGGENETSIGRTLVGDLQLLQFACRSRLENRMKLQLEWARPIPLRDAGREENLLYTFDYSKLPEVTGVYVLGRRFGRTFEALYVGKAGALRGRVRGQLKNLPLMLHLKKAKTGKRIVLAARFISRPGQQEKKCLTLLERALIRYFLSEGHDLVNKQGVRLRRHEITSKNPRRLVPRLMFVDRAKGD